MNLTSGAFSIENRISYPIYIKEMAIQMKQKKIPVKTIMEELGIKNIY